MGRTFENRKHAIAKRGARDAKAFTKAGRQLSMAARAGGPDPDANPALRRAILNARAVSMPKDKIQNAIEKASGASQDSNFEDVVYEGYGPHGSAFVVVATTDNPTRTVANVRSHFKKGGGNLGASGSVAFMFSHWGAFVVRPEGLDREALEFELIDHGLENLVVEQDAHGKPLWVITCARDAFGAMQAALEAHQVVIERSGFRWDPTSNANMTAEQFEDVAALFERLDDDDDVQEVFCNAETAE